MGRFLVTVDLNGRADGWRQLFEQLKREGASVSGSCESWTTGAVLPFYMKDELELLETIRREYDAGRDGLEFEGEYAVMYCSAAGSRIVLTNGWSGTRRMYYFVEDGKLTVGSNIYDLLRRKKERKFSIASCYEFLAYEFVSDPNTLFDGIFVVPHGCRVHIGPDGDISLKETGARLSETDESYGPDMYGELRSRIVAAHGKRVTRSNGIYLSGGIDSSVMAITLRKDLGLDDLTAFTFATKDAVQDESDQAKAAASQLGIRFEKVVVDPDKPIDLEDLISRANFPYPGMIMLSNLADTVGDCGMAGINLFAGQDTRLHTPGYNMLDRMVLCTLLELPFCRGAVAKAARFSSHLPLQEKLKRGMRRLSSAQDLAAYLAGNFFHRHAASSISGSSFSARYAEEFRRSISEKLPASLSSRKIFNLIVDQAWDRQYTDDMAYMIGITESYGNHCSMPFYDRELAAFAATLPMQPALKRTKGKAGHGNRSKRVNKYLLRKAFASDLTDDLVYRDKAVCVTGFNYLNGSLGSYVAEYFAAPRLAGGEMDQALGLAPLFRRGLEKNGAWQMTDYEEVVETHNLLFLEQIARTYNVSS
jgi:asparagine synthase (glutamine-hydrolysing)